MLAYEKLVGNGVEQNYKIFSLIFERIGPKLFAILINHVSNLVVYLLAQFLYCRFSNHCSSSLWEFYYLCLQAASKAGIFNGKVLVLAWYNAVQHLKRSSAATTSNNQPSKIQRRETRRSSVSSLLEEDKDEADLVSTYNLKIDSS